MPHPLELVQAKMIKDSSTSSMQITPGPGKSPIFNPSIYFQSLEGEKFRVNSRAKVKSWIEIRHPWSLRRYFLEPVWVWIKSLTTGVQVHCTEWATFSGEWGHYLCVVCPSRFFMKAGIDLRITPRHSLEIKFFKTSVLLKQVRNLRGAGAVLVPH